MNLIEIYESYKTNNEIIFKRKYYDKILKIKRFDELKNYHQFGNADSESTKNLYIVMDIDDPIDGENFAVMCQLSLLDAVADDYEIIEGMVNEAT
jgi:hypothetical protein